MVVSIVVVAVLEEQEEDKETRWVVDMILMNRIVVIDPVVSIEKARRIRTMVIHVGPVLVVLVVMGVHILVVHLLMDISLPFPLISNNNNNNNNNFLVIKILVK